MERNELYVIYGKELAAMTVRLAEEADLAALIGDRGKRVGLKPNLVTAKPASSGATTHPEIAAGLIAYLKKNGFNKLTILEGSWTGGSTSDAFNVCGYRKLAGEAGVELIDTKRDKTKTCDCGGMKLEICQSALSMDFMINLPVLKGHCQTRLTCALKNNKGLIPDREKSRFHTLGLTRPIAHLNLVLRSDFIVVDGICGDPDSELGGNPLYGGRLFAARDPVLCDAWAASLMGYSLDAIPYIGLAEELGIGSADLRGAKVRELNSAGGQNSADSRSSAAVSASAASVHVASARAVSASAASAHAASGALAQGGPAPGGKVSRLAPYIAEDNACSACYAALIFALSRIKPGRLERLKEKICVGQGFKGKHGNIGIGQCCAAFRRFCSGCPPTGGKVLDFLDR